MNKYIRITLLMIIDALLIAFSVYLSYLLRFDFKIQAQFIPTLPYVISAYIIVALTSLYGYKIYKRVWQYASIGDLISILKGALSSSVFLFLIYYSWMQFFDKPFVVPRSIFILATMIIFLTVGGARFLWRIIRDNYIKIQPHHRRALVVGAGDAGTMVVKELKHSNSELYPIAFIDDNVQKKNLEVMGVPVLGGRNDILDIANNHNIQDIVIALPSATRMEIAQILSICKETGCQIKIIPRVNDLINGKISINMIRDVSVEDLLGRDPVQIDLSEISDYLSNQVILITGAGGSIGSELSRQIAGFKPAKLLLLGRGENSIYDIELEIGKNYPDVDIEPIIADVQNLQRLESVFQEYRPTVVFHAAAHKHVPLMEKNPLEAVKNNILGTRNVAECAHQYGSGRFVMISTDKAVNPTSIMGASKRIAEMVIQGYNQKSKTLFTAVRFGNVLGSRGSVIPVFKRQIEQGGPVTVTHPEMIRYFMTIPEAVQLVIQAGALTSGGEVYILDMGQPVKIADLAKDLIRLSGLEPKKDIDIVYSGIRPGEKLFEELLTNDEGTLATKHDRIYIGKANGIDAGQLETMLKSFEYIALQKDWSSQESVKKEFQRWLPNFLDLENEISDARMERALKSSLEVVAAVQTK